MTEVKTKEDAPTVSLDAVTAQIQMVICDLNRLVLLVKSLDLDLKIELVGNEDSLIFPNKEHYVATLTKTID